MEPYNPGNGLPPADAPSQSATRQQVTPRSIEAARPRAHVTQALIAVNVLVFVLMVLKGVSPIAPTPYDLYRWGADFGPATVGGQWWRLFTAMFLHFGIIHIGLNMYVFYQVGNYTEVLFGKVKYLLLYLATGVFGNLVSLLIHPQEVGAGASGAIFGVYGAFLGFLFVRRKFIPKPVMQQMLSSTGRFLGINLVYGLISPTTDLSAHVGGLVSGLLLGTLLTQRPRSA